MESTHLIEDGLVGTDEAPLEHFLLAVRILDGIADMEQLAVIGHVRVVAVPGHVAGEGHVSRSRRTHPRPSQLNSSTMFSRMESASETRPRLAEMGSWVGPAASSSCLCTGNMTVNTDFSRTILVYISNMDISRFHDMGLWLVGNINGLKPLLFTVIVNYRKHGAAASPCAARRSTRPPGRARRRGRRRRWRACSECPLL